MFISQFESDTNKKQHQQITPPPILFSMQEVKLKDGATEVNLIIEVKSLVWVIIAKMINHACPVDMAPMA